MESTLVRVLRTLACAGAIALTAAGSALGANLNVNITTDPDNGVGQCATGGACSLREAINTANETSGDNITVQPGTYTLTQGIPLTPRTDMTIGGVALDATVSGNNATQIFDIEAGASVTMEGMNLEYGDNTSSSGGAILVQGGATLTLQSVFVSASTAVGGGGGIESEGTLVLDDSALVGNSATSGSNGGGLELGDDAGDVSQATITDSTISYNTASQGVGGGIEEQGEQSAPASVAVKLVASTVNDNSALSGGGISDSYGGLGSDPATFAITNSTIAENTASSYGGGLNIGNGPTADPLVNDTIADNKATDSGGDIEVGSGAPPTVLNTIVAGGTARDNADCAGGTLTSEGHNLDQQDNCGFGATGDQVNVASPGLAPLADNGGSTYTMALDPGSPAVNAGSNTGCPSTDQRGVVRPQGSACDIGAYELAPPVYESERVGSLTLGSNSSATVSVTVANPDVEAGKVDVEYGTTAAFGSTTATKKLYASSAATVHTFALAGLKPATTYHYLIKMSNPDGAIAVGGTFTTPPPNDFTLRHPTVSTTGALLTHLTAPGAGKFTAKATFRYRTSVVTHRHGALYASGKLRTETYGKGQVTVSHKGATTLRMKLSAPAAKELRKLGHAKVTVSISFTPVHGTRFTKITHLTVRYKGKGKGGYS